MTAITYRVIVTDDVDPVLVEHDSMRYEGPPQNRQDALALTRLLLGVAAPPDDHGPWRQARRGGQRTVQIRTAA